MALLPVLLLLPVLFFWSSLVNLYLALRHRQPALAKVRISQRGICLFLALVMLLSPEGLVQLAQADVQYSQLCTNSWGKGGQVITYTYDENGAVETKTTVENATTVETVVYDYNLQGRLKQVTVSRSGEDDVVTEYKYDVDGNRVEKSVTVGTAPAVVTKYLIDPANHTGYAQTLIEADGSGTIVYTVGDDVLAQAKNGTTQWLLYDGQGSTRQLVNAANSVDDSYCYDAYGVLLQEDTTALRTRPGYVDQTSIATNLLYAGEHFDTDTQQYYNRARWYDPLNGRFDRVDPYAGNMNDPQSLHKYLYCHANPVNGVDPSGEMFAGFSLGGLGIAMLIGAVIGGIVSGIVNTTQQLINGGEFNLKKLLIEVGCGAIIGALSGAAGYAFSFIAKAFLGIFNIGKTTATIGTGALVGAASAFVGQILTELKYWIVDDKPFVFKDSMNRVFLASFAGLIMGGLITKISLWRGWVSDIKYAYEIKGAPASGYLKPIPVGWHSEPIPVSTTAALKVHEIGIIGGVVGEYFVDWLDE